MDNGAARIRAVECEAEVWRIKSNADMSYDVTFQFPEHMLPQIQWMMSHLHDMVRMVIEEK